LDLDVCGVGSPDGAVFDADVAGAVEDGGSVGGGEGGHGWMRMGHERIPDLLKKESGRPPPGRQIS